MREIGVVEFLLLILSVISHVGMSLFLAKPRFNRVVTALIWLVFSIVFLGLPAQHPRENFIISLVLNGVLFFFTTKGKPSVKGFLFLSYICIYTCFSTMVTYVGARQIPLAAKITFVILTMVVLQLLLYYLLLPKFKRFSTYINGGWAKYYAIVIAFFIMIAAQSIYLPDELALSNAQFIYFMLTVVSFFVVYASLFASLQDAVNYEKERRRQLHSELLILQVEAQEKEIEYARQFKHDMHHHYDALMSYASAGETERIIDYIKQYMEQTASYAPKTFCENHTINSILGVYQEKAKNKGIDFEVQASTRKTLGIAPPDIVTVFANVIENALNGAELAPKNGRYIKLDIFHKGKKIVLNCSNSCDLDLDFDDMPEQMRSTGIKSICSVVEKHNGNCRFVAGAGQFECIVIMDA